MQKSYFRLSFKWVVKITNFYSIWHSDSREMDVLSIKVLLDIRKIFKFLWIIQKSFKALLNLIPLRAKSNYFVQEFPFVREICFNPTQNVIQSSISVTTN